MITPDNKIPLDDSENSQADDQMSQKDIHSNGLEEEDVPTHDDGSTDADRLRRASDAAEPSFTLNTDDE